MFNELAWRNAFVIFENMADSVNAIWLDNINLFDFYDQPEAFEKVAVNMIAQCLENTRSMGDMPRVRERKKRTNLSRNYDSV